MRDMVGYIWACIQAIEKPHARVSGCNDSPFSRFCLNILRASRFMLVLQQQLQWGSRIYLSWKFYCF